MCPGLILLALPIAHESSHELACQKLIKGGVQLTAIIDIIIYAAMYLHRCYSEADSTGAVLGTEPLIIITQLIPRLIFAN